MSEENSPTNMDKSTILQEASDVIDMETQSFETLTSLSADSSIVNKTVDSGDKDVPAVETNTNVGEDSTKYVIDDTFHQLDIDKTQTFIPADTTQVTSNGCKDNGSIIPTKKKSDDYAISAVEYVAPNTSDKELESITPVDKTAEDHPLLKNEEPVPNKLADAEQTVYVDEFTEISKPIEEDKINDITLSATSTKEADVNDIPLSTEKDKLDKVDRDGFSSVPIKIDNTKDIPTEAYKVDDAPVGDPGSKVLTKRRNANDALLSEDVVLSCEDKKSDTLEVTENLPLSANENDISNGIATADTESFRSSHKCSEVEGEDKADLSKDLSASKNNEIVIPIDTKIAEDIPLANTAFPKLVETEKDKSVPLLERESTTATVVQKTDEICISAPEETSLSKPTEDKIKIAPPFSSHITDSSLPGEEKVDAPKQPNISVKSSVGHKSLNGETPSSTNSKIDIKKKKKHSHNRSSRSRSKNAREEQEKTKNNKSKSKSSVKHKLQKAENKDHRNNSKINENTKLVDSEKRKLTRSSDHNGRSVLSINENSSKVKCSASKHKHTSERTRKFSRERNSDKTNSIIKIEEHKKDTSVDVVVQETTSVPSRSSTLNGKISINEGDKKSVENKQSVCKESTKVSNLLTPKSSTPTNVIEKQENESGTEISNALSKCENNTDLRNVSLESQEINNTSKLTVGVRSSDRNRKTDSSIPADVMNKDHTSKTESHKNKNTTPQHSTLSPKITKPGLLRPRNGNKSATINKEEVKKTASLLQTSKEKSSIDTPSMGKFSGRSTRQNSIETPETSIEKPEKINVKMQESADEEQDSKSKGKKKTFEDLLIEADIALAASIKNKDKKKSFEDVLKEREIVSAAGTRKKNLHALTTGDIVVATASPAKRTPGTFKSKNVIMEVNASSIAEDLHGVPNKKFTRQSQVQSTSSIQESNKREYDKNLEMKASERKDSLGKSEEEKKLRTHDNTKSGKMEETAEIQSGKLEKDSLKIALSGKTDTLTLNRKSSRLNYVSSKDQVTNKSKSNNDKKLNSNPLGEKKEKTDAIHKSGKMENTTEIQSGKLENDSVKNAPSAKAHAETPNRKSSRLNYVPSASSKDQETSGSESSNDKKFNSNSPKKQDKEQSQKSVFLLEVRNSRTDDSSKSAKFERTIEIQSGKLEKDSLKIAPSAKTPEEKSNRKSSRLSFVPSASSNGQETIKGEAKDDKILDYSTPEKQDKDRSRKSSSVAPLQEKKRKIDDNINSGSWNSKKKLKIDDNSKSGSHETSTRSQKTSKVDSDNYSELNYSSTERKLRGQAGKLETDLPIEEKELKADRKFGRKETGRLDKSNHSFPRDNDNIKKLEEVSTPEKRRGRSQKVESYVHPVNEKTAKTDNIKVGSDKKENTIELQSSKSRNTTVISIETDKKSEELDTPEKKGRGRPRKSDATAPLQEKEQKINYISNSVINKGDFPIEVPETKIKDDSVVSVGVDKSKKLEDSPEKRGRGRPRKSESDLPVEEANKSGIRKDNATQVLSAKTDGPGSTESYKRGRSRSQKSETVGLSQEIELKALNNTNSGRDKREHIKLKSVDKEDTTSKKDSVVLTDKNKSSKSEDLDISEKKGQCRQRNSDYTTPLQEKDRKIDDNSKSVKNKRELTSEVHETKIKDVSVVSAVVDKSNKLEDTSEKRGRGKPRKAESALPVEVNRSGISKNDNVTNVQSEKINIDSGVSSESDKRGRSRSHKSETVVPSQEIELKSLNKTKSGHDKKEDIKIQCNKSNNEELSSKTKSVVLNEQNQNKKSECFDTSEKKGRGRKSETETPSGHQNKIGKVFSVKATSETSMRKSGRLHLDDASVLTENKVENTSTGEAHSETPKRVSGRSFVATSGNSETESAPPANSNTLESVAQEGRARSRKSDLVVLQTEKVFRNEDNSKTGSDKGENTTELPASKRRGRSRKSDLVMPPPEKMLTTEGNSQEQLKTINSQLQETTIESKYLNGDYVNSPITKNARIRSRKSASKSSSNERLSADDSKFLQYIIETEVKSKELNSDSIKSAATNKKSEGPQNDNTINSSEEQLNCDKGKDDKTETTNKTSNLNDDSVMDESNASTKKCRGRPRKLESTISPEQTKTDSSKNGRKSDLVMPSPEKMLRTGYNSKTGGDNKKNTIDVQQSKSNNDTMKNARIRSKKSASKSSSNEQLNADDSKFLQYIIETEVKSKDLNSDSIKSASATKEPEGPQNDITINSSEEQLNTDDSKFLQYIIETEVKSKELNSDSIKSVAATKESEGPQNDNTVNSSEKQLNCDEGKEDKTSNLNDDSVMDETNASTKKSRGRPRKFESTISPEQTKTDSSKKGRDRPRKSDAKEQLENATQKDKNETAPDVQTNVLNNEIAISTSSQQSRILGRGRSRKSENTEIEKEMELANSESSQIKASETSQRSGRVIKRKVDADYRYFSSSGPNGDVSSDIGRDEDADFLSTPSKHVRKKLEDVSQSEIKTGKRSPKDKKRDGSSRRRSKASKLRESISSTDDQSDSDPIPSKRLKLTERTSPVPVGRVLTGDGPRIMFIGVTGDLSGAHKTVKELGGEIVDTPVHATHLVTDKLRRTIKVLCMLAQGKPIVRLDWILHCKKANAFEDYQRFLIKDHDIEKQYDFCLSKSLAMAAQQRLFQGYEIHVTSGVLPPPTLMRDIIECAGGKYMSGMPTGSSADKKTVVISTPRDLTYCKEAINAGVPVVGAEYILTGVLKQDADIQTYSLT